jgi:NADH:ubiquinone oxidoreductase subunit 2 (subunit N)
MISKPGFKLLILAGVLRVRVRRVLSISQKNVKKILGLSSVFSLGWVLVSFDFRQLI